jgi:hypothetical protein
MPSPDRWFSPRRTGGDGTASSFLAPEAMFHFARGSLFSTNAPQPLAERAARPSRISLKKISFCLSSNASMPTGW